MPNDGLQSAQPKKSWRLGLGPQFLNSAKLKLDMNPTNPVRRNPTQIGSDWE